MKTDSEGLHKIANTSNSDRRADVVFVHGLGGSSHSTWRHGKVTDADHYFWPEELGKVLPECGIWSFGYAAGITGMGNPGMSIEKRGGNFASQLVAAGIGTHPVVFIVHSMGGLIIKSLIASRESLDDGRRKVVQNIRGIVFCGTPHRGSDYVRASTILGMVTRGVQGHVRQMKANSESLDHLHDAFLAWVRNSKAKIVTFAEGIGLWRKGWLRRMAQLNLVVERASANTGCGSIHDTDADHLSLVKLTPANRSVYEIVFFHTCKLAQEVLQINRLASEADADSAAEQQDDIAPSFHSGSVEPLDTKLLGRNIAPSRILRHSPPKLFGRDAWLDALDEAWAARDKVNVYTLVAWGGVGKTSLVAHWVTHRLAAKGWPGVERYFDWSFYSQGTGESRQTSSDLFISEALRFFGDSDPVKGSPWDRGERLASLVRQHRTLLVLDGIEPLQYPVNDPQAGRLKDEALAVLLQSLAADNPGLCVITTREHLKNVESFSTTQEQRLDKLLKEAAVAMLRHLQIVGTEAELEAAWKDAGGHALTLQLLGRFLADAHGGDIRKRDQVDFEEIDAEQQGRSAFKVMKAYERWLQSVGPERQRELAILRLAGLFDRPISADCLKALRAAPTISGLTDTLVPLTSAQLNTALTRLLNVDLITHSEPGPGQMASDLSIDAHPLIREYFAKQLREKQPEAFKAAHSRLFDHLCQSTPRQPDTLEGLQPLYQAVVHGCLAERHRESREDVYRDRILRGTGRDGFYSQRQLGAIGADLAAVAAFFDEPWSRVSPKVPETDHAWLLNEASYSLRALGRLTEALEPIRVGLAMRIRDESWGNAAISAGNLSELEVALGRLPDAVSDGRRAIDFADRSGKPFQQMSKRTTTADALHQSGDRLTASELFAEAERRQPESQPESDLLYSLPGSRYCDLLLAHAERAAWQQVLATHRGTECKLVQGDKEIVPHIGDAVLEVERRATKAIEVAKRKHWLLDMALDHLTLARVGLYRVVLSENYLPLGTNLPHIADAVNGLRVSGQFDEIPKGYFTASLYHYIRNDQAAARRALDEAWQIAERGPMPLYLCDVHLHRARLFFREPTYPWNKNPDGSRRRPADDLTAAEKIINECGYHRRDEELADAKRVILGSEAP